MIINHNLSAINAARVFGINSKAMDKVAEKLASGMRINRAADDAAGLAVSEKMRSQIRGLHQASRNAQDGISLVQTAEGWLQETTDILQRMGELAVQSANGIYTAGDRAQIQVEIDQLMAEVDRIADHAEFNELKLLNGNFAADGTQTPETGDGATVGPNDLIIHVGANMDQRTVINIGSMTTEALGLKGGGTAPAAGDQTQNLEAVSLAEQEAANKSIATIHSAINLVTKQRADLGAYQNRLEHAIRGIDIAAENLQAAESQIRDTDMAKEMVEYVKYTILSQSSSSMLAQANMKPTIVMKLLM